MPSASAPRLPRVAILDASEKEAFLEYDSITMLLTLAYKDFLRERLPNLQELPLDEVIHSYWMDASSIQAMVSGKDTPEFDTFGRALQEADIIFLRVEPFGSPDSIVQQLKIAWDQIVLKSQGINIGDPTREVIEKMLGEWLLDEVQAVNPRARIIFAIDSRCELFEKSEPYSGTWVDGKPQYRLATFEACNFYKDPFAHEQRFNEKGYMGYLTQILGEVHDAIREHARYGRQAEEGLSRWN